MLKYFSLHFYNNLLDDPPSSCATPKVIAPGPHLIHALKCLTAAIRSNRELCTKDLVYYVHLIMDLHQPFHCTKAAKGGIQQRLHSADGTHSVSLHALWDAEMLKLIMQSKRVVNVISVLIGLIRAKDVMFVLNCDYVEKFVKEQNYRLCAQYWPLADETIETYTARQMEDVVILVFRAAIIISGTLNWQAFRAGPWCATSNRLNWPTCSCQRTNVSLR